MLCERNATKTPNEQDQHKTELPNEQRRYTAIESASKTDLYRHIASINAVSRGDEHVSGLGLGYINSQQIAKEVLNCEIL